MPELTAHPSQEQLSAYNLGQLPPDEAAAIESHINECEPCCDTIVSLSSDDTFVGLLKEARQLPTDQTVDHAVPTATSPRQDIPVQLAGHPRYEILGLIGKGGMGDVYKAKHRKMERTVALKVINRGLVQRTEAVDRFHREVKAAAQLSHPNIVTAHDADQSGDFHFMVMEYVDGVDLSQMVNDRGALPVAKACDYVRQAANGLQHAHERGMVHRDIKPHNLMVTLDGTVKILDFGLASLAPEAIADTDTVEARGDLTAAGAIMGTPDFISPEQADDARAADIRSDIYSLGATLYFLLSGRPPFADGSVMHKLKSHAQAEPEPLESLRDDVPPELVAVVTKMTAKDPAERYLTPREVADALESFLRAWRPDDAASPGKEPSGGGYGSGSDGQKPGTGDAGRDWLPVAAQGFFYLMWIPIALLLWEVFFRDQTSDAADIRFYFYMGAAICLSTIAGALGAAQRFKQEMREIERGDRRVFRLRAGETLLMVGILIFSAASIYKFYFSDSEGYSMVSGGAGSSGDGWYVSAGSTYLKQDEPGVLFGMYENPEGDRSFSYIVLFRHKVNERTEVSSAGNTGLQFDGETATIKDGLSIDGKGIELDLEMRMDRQEIQSSELVINGKATDASKGRLILVDLTAGGVTWNQVNAKFPHALLAPKDVVRDTYLVTKVARQVTEQLAKDNDQVRKFLEGATVKPNANQNAADQPSLTIKNDGTWKTHLGTESRSWDLHGNHLGEVVVRLLHISKGELNVASEHEFGCTDISGETNGRITLVAEGKQEEQLSLSLHTKFEDISEDAVRTRSTPLIIPKGLLRSGATINVDWEGQRLFPQETTFVHTMVMLPEGGDWGEISHRKDDTDSMVEASKRGAEFVVITLDWIDEATLKQVATTDVERLQGDWDVIAFTQDGKKEFAADKGVSMLVQIKGETIIRSQTTPNGQKSEKEWGRIELSSTTNPKSIDIINPDSPDDRLLGIYELKDGALKICFVAEQSDIDVAEGQPVKRPATFAAPTGSSNVLLECRRKQPGTDGEASAPRTILDQGYKILDGGKEIGSRRLVVTENDQTLSIVEEYSLALKFEGAPLGIVERNVSAVYSVAGDTPLLMRGTNSTKEQGSLVMHGTVEFNNGEALTSWTSYTDGGRKLEPPTKQQATVKPPPGPLVLGSTIQLVGPLLLPEDGECKVVGATFNNKVRDGKPLVEYEAGCRLRRTSRPEGAGFTITVFKPDSDEPEMTWDYDSQGNCESIQLSRTTVMKPNEAATEPRAERGNSILNSEQVEKTVTDDERTQETWQVILELFEAWKKVPGESDESAEFANRISEIHRDLKKANTPNTESSRQTSARLALLAWPHLSDAMPIPMAQTIADLTEPDAAVRISDRMAEQSRPTEPLGWDVQAAHALALARAGKIEEALKENEALMKKIDVNVRKGRVPDSQSEFLGKMRSTKSLLQQSLLQKALILAIAGKTAESVDASTAAGRVEVNKPTQDDQAAIQEMLQVLVKAAERSADGKQASESDGAAVRKTTAFLVEAVERGDTAAVKAALNAGVKPNVPANPLAAKQLTALHWAVAQRISDDGKTIEPSAEIAKLLIEAGADVNAADYLGQTPLEWAAKFASPEIVEMLIKAGANVKAESRYGTVLEVAKNVEIAKLLIENGADVNAGTTMTPLAKAAQSNNLEMVRLLIDEGAQVNDPKNPPIHWAGKPDVAKALLDAGADVNLRNAKGETVLHLPAVSFGPDAETVKFLIDAGAEVKAKNATGSTPLQAAIQQGKPEIAKLLIAAGADVDAKDEQGNTPLSVAHANLSWARRNPSAIGDNKPYETAVQLLVDAGAKDDGRTKLQHAVAAGDLEQVEKLIAAKADVNETGPQQITAVHLASEKGHAEILSALVEAGAKVDVVDAQRLQPLHLAANAETARLLIANGAKVNTGTPSPLYMATMNGKVDVVRELLRNDANAKDSDCATMLNWATFAGQLEVVKALFELRDAKTLLAVKSTYSPLHVAASGSFGDMGSSASAQQRLDIAKLLVENGADVNARWGSNINPLSGAAHMIGTTPLMFASQRGEAEMVTFLLDQKADPKATNASGQTALHFAAQYGHREVVELLLKAKADVNALTREAETPLDLTQDAGVKVLLIQNGGKTASEVLKDSKR